MLLEANRVGLGPPVLPITGDQLSSVIIHSNAHPSGEFMPNPWKPLLGQEDQPALQWFLGRHKQRHIFSAAFSSFTTGSDDNLNWNFLLQHFPEEQPHPHNQETNCYIGHKYETPFSQLKFICLIFYTW